MKKRLFTLMLMLTTLGAAVPASAAAIIKVGGGGAAIAGVISPIHIPFEDETGVQLELVPSTPAQGLIALSQGRVDIAMAAASFEHVAKEAADRGAAIDPLQYSVTVVGSNRTLVFINKSVPVVRLSKQDLQDIFTGKITNWDKFTRKDQPIRVVWGEKTPGQNWLFTEKILDGKPVTSTAIKATDYQHIREIIAKTPGAIGIDPQGFISAVAVNPVTPEISAPVIAITRRNPPPEVIRVLEYLKLTSF